MNTLKRSCSLLCLGFAVYGCAAPTAREDARGEEIGNRSEALTESNLLALGDSIAFGYNPFADFTKIKNFNGYPEVLDDDFDGVKNAACPGETSGSLFSTTAQDNGCRAYRAAYPLHVSYGNKPTQLDYALSKLSDPSDRTTTITLNVSGNDFFVLQKNCNFDPTCIANGVPGVIGAIAQNVGTIFGRIRQAGYQGQLVYMNLYSTNYADTNTTGVVFQTNQYASQAARSFGATIADAFGAFAAASGASGNACAAGLLIPLPSGTGCDVHPSALGTEILAQTVREAH